MHEGEADAGVESRSAASRKLGSEEVTDELHYAEDFIRQSEDFMRAEKEKSTGSARCAKYNVELWNMFGCIARQKHVEMDEKEEKVNRG